MGFVPRQGVDNYRRSQLWPLLPAGVARRSGCARFGRTAARHLHAAEDGGARIAVSGLPPGFTFQDGSNMEVGVNPNIEDIRDAVHDQQLAAASA